MIQSSGHTVLLKSDLDVQQTGLWGQAFYRFATTANLNVASEYIGQI